MEESWWEWRWSPLFWTTSTEASQQRENEIIGWRWDKSLWFRKLQRGSADGGIVHSPTSSHHSSKQISLAGELGGLSGISVTWAEQTEMLLSGGRAILPQLILTPGPVQAAGLSNHCLSPSESIFGVLVLYPLILHFLCPGRVSVSSSSLQLLQNIPKVLACASVILDYIFEHPNLSITEFPAPE